MHVKTLSAWRMVSKRNKGREDENCTDEEEDVRRGITQLTHYLLWRWSVKVMVVLRDRWIAELKDTLHITEVTQASWL